MQWCPCDEFTSAGDWLPLPLGEGWGEGVGLRENPLAHRPTPPPDLPQRGRGKTSFAGDSAGEAGQQRGVSTSGGGVDRHRLFGTEAIQIVRSTRLRACAA